MSLSYRQYLQRMNQNPGPLERSGGLNKYGGLPNNYKITSPPSSFSKNPVVQQKPIKQDVKMEPANKQDESPLPDKPPLEQKSVLPNKKSPLPDIKILNQQGGLIKTEKGKARRKKVMNKIDSSFKDDDGIDDEETENLVEGTIAGVERHMTLYSELSDQTEKGDAIKINELLASIDTAEKENIEKLDKIAEKYAEGKMSTKTLKKVLPYIHDNPKQMKKHFKGLRSDYKTLQSSKKTQTSVSAPQSSNATPEKEPKALNFDKLSPENTNAPSTPLESKIDIDPNFEIDYYIDNPDSLDSIARKDDIDNIIKMLKEATGVTVTKNVGSKHKTIPEKIKDVKEALKKVPKNYKFMQELNKYTREQIAEYAKNAFDITTANKTKETLIKEIKDANLAQINIPSVPKKSSEINVLSSSIYPSPENVDDLQKILQV
jgi:hypothetical protein